jgi:hypothetical protein
MDGAEVKTFEVSGVISFRQHRNSRDAVFLLAIVAVYILQNLPR